MLHSQLEARWLRDYTVVVAQRNLIRVELQFVAAGRAEFRREACWASLAAGS